MSPLVAVTALLLAAPPATPRVRFTVPLVIPLGVKTTVVLRGTALDGTTTVTASDPAAKVKLKAARKSPPANKELADRLGDSEVEVELELPKDAPADGLTLTAVGPAGSSPAFAVAQPLKGVSRVAEKESNDGFAQAQPVAVPAAVDGTIGRDKDVDVFRVTGKPGDVVRLSVEAAKWGSPLDARLSVHDAAGHLLGSADDTAGSPDPALTVTLPADGACLVTVSDANDLGGPQYGYRLVLTAGK